MLSDLQTRGDLWPPGRDQLLRCKRRRNWRNRALSSRVVSMPLAPRCLINKARSIGTACCHRICLPWLSSSSSDYWRKYVGRSGAVIQIQHICGRPPPSVQYFGITTERLCDTVRCLLSSRSTPPPRTGALGDFPMQASHLF